MATAIKLALSRQGRFNFGKGKFTAGPLGPNTVRRLKGKFKSRLDERLARARHFQEVGFSRGKLFGKFEGRYNEKGKLLGLVARSKPGEPPLFQTGRLRNSISSEMIDPFTVRVGTNVKYARWLEFGTRGGRVITPKGKKALYDPVSRQFFGKRVVQGAIKARPFFRPTVNRMRQEIMNTLSGGA